MDDWLDDWDGPDLGNTTENQQEFDEEVCVTHVSLLRRQLRSVLAQCVISEITVWDIEF
jgi:hypothetical protein